MGSEPSSRLEEGQVAGLAFQPRPAPARIVLVCQPALGVRLNVQRIGLRPVHCGDDAADCQGGRAAPRSCLCERIHRRRVRHAMQPKPDLPFWNAGLDKPVLVGDGTELRTLNEAAAFIEAHASRQESLPFDAAGLSLEQAGTVPT